MGRVRAALKRENGEEKPGGANNLSMAWSMAKTSLWGLEMMLNGKDFHSVSFHQKNVMAERSLKLEYLNLSQAKWKETLCTNSL